MSHDSYIEWKVWIYTSQMLCTKTLNFYKFKFHLQHNYFIQLSFVNVDEIVFGEFIQGLFIQIISNWGW